MKYSAFILFIALAVCWSSAEARYNKYQQDVIDAMTNWAVEEMRDVPEPHKTRLVNQLTEAKDKKWASLGEYFKHEKQIMEDFVAELMRSKRSIQYESAKGNLIEQIEKIRNIF